MPNVTISDLPDAIIPLDTTTTFFEVQAIESGVNVSRRVRGDMITFSVFPPPTVEGSIVRGDIAASNYLESLLVNISDTTVNTVSIDGVANGAVALTLLGINTPVGLDSVIQFQENGAGTFRMFYDSTFAGFKQRLDSPGIIQFEEGDGTVILADFNSVTGQQRLWAGTVGVDVPVTRTVLPASGGLEVDNQVTGAGFERVLTTSDAGGGGGVTIEDEGTPLPTVATTLDFVGAGVTATGVGTTKTITIPGGAAIALNDLTDVDIAGVATGDILYKSAGDWLDTGSISVDPGTLVTINDDLTIVSALLDLDHSGFAANVDSRMRNSAGGYLFRVTSIGQTQFYQTDAAGVNEDLRWVATRNGDWLFYRDGSISLTLGLQNVSIGDFVNGYTLTVRGANSGSIGGRFTLNGAPTFENFSIQNTGGNKSFVLGSQSRLILADNAGVVFNYSNTLVGADLNATGWKVDGSELRVNAFGLSDDAGLFMYSTNGGVALVVDQATGDITLSSTNGSGSVQESFATFTRDADVALFFNNIEVARTLTVVTGGLEVNNQLTGAGFERVLTTSDLGGSLPASTAEFAALSANNAGGWLERTAVRIDTNSVTIQPVGDDALLDVHGNGSNQDAQVTVRADGGGMSMFWDESTDERRLHETSASGANGDMILVRDTSGRTVLNHISNNRVARTISASTGGLEANNQLTGAGFERVLTTSDLTSSVSSITRTNSTTLTTVTPVSYLNLAAVAVGDYWIQASIEVAISSAEDDLDLRLRVGTGGQGTIDANVLVTAGGVEAAQDEPLTVLDNDVTLETDGSHNITITGFLRVTTLGTVDLQLSKDTDVSSDITVRRGFLTLTVL